MLFSATEKNFATLTGANELIRKEKANIVLLQALNRNYCDNHLLQSQLRGTMIIDIRIILYILIIYI